MLDSNVSGWIPAIVRIENSIEGINIVPREKVSYLYKSRNENSQVRDFSLGIEFVSGAM